MKKVIRKKISKVLNTFENIMENEAFAQRSKCSIIHNIKKNNMIFQRSQKALLLSKGLKQGLYSFQRIIYLD